MGSLVLDRFRVLKHLTAGGVGELWLARDEDTDRTVVLKTLRERYADDPALRARFLEEALLHLRLSHPGIVRALDAGRWEQRHTLVLEYIDGVTLAELLDACGPRLPPRWVAHVGASTARALAALHAQRDLDGGPLVHQDVSPQNIMVDAQGRVVIIDFGLASSGTRARGVCQGKPSYMAPEQARAEAVDARTDQHALGLVLVEAMTGELPLAQVPEVLLLQTLAQVQFLPLPEGVDPTLAPLLTRMLSVDPARRLASCDEVADVLEAWCCGRDVPDDLGPAVRHAQEVRTQNRRHDEATTVVEGPR